MKRIVEVFPDYCSTGLWLINESDSHSRDVIVQEHIFGDHVCVDPEEVGVSSGLQLALRYWHEMWEFNITCSYTDEECEAAQHRHMSQPYEARWVEDGRKLAAALSAENDKFEFIYKQSKYGV